MNQDDEMTADDLVDLDNPNPTPTHYILQRWNTCISCDRLLKVTRQCKECGCFMKVKVRLRNASCPIGKWGPVAD